MTKNKLIGLTEKREYANNYDEILPAKGGKRTFDISQVILR